MRRERSTGSSNPCSTWKAVPLAGLVLMASWVGCGPSDDATRGDAGPPVAESPPAQRPAAEPPAAGDGPSAREILERMVEVYRSAASYGDQGRVRIHGERDERELDQEVPYLVAFQRPDRLRVQAHQGILVADGQTVWAYAVHLPNQVLRRPLAGPLTLAPLLADSVFAEAIAQAWTQVYSLVPVQALLLLAEDPLKTLLHDARQVERIESAALDTATCHRIRLTRPDGEAVLWIDESTFLLRRMEFPTVELNKAIAGGRLRDFTVVADFTGAKVGEAIDPNAFRFKMPADARLVDAFLPPELALLGQPSPPFTFVGLDGRELTPASLAGKVAVIDFWATWCPPCRDSLPVLEKVIQDLGAEDRVAVVAVSVDTPDVGDEKLRSTFTELGVDLPIARDPEQFAGKAFLVTGIPAMVILDAEGNVQAMEAGFHPNYATDLTKKLNRLLAGEAVYTEKLASFRERSQAVVDWLAEKVRDERFWGPLVLHPVPEAEIAPRSDPKRLRLETLWTCEEFQLPGNMAVVEDPEGADRVLILENEDSIVELGPDGRVRKSRALPVEAGEPLRLLRAARDGQGRWWFAVSASGGPRLRVLDAQLDPVLEYPPKADQFPHAGIGDVQFGDLDHDGTPELCVGYWGDVGLQGVSLEGVRLWRNRRVANVLRVAVLGVDSQGHRNVLCTNQMGNLAMIGPQGEGIAEIPVAGRLINWIVAADLDGDASVELCALSPTEEGRHVALGLNLHGDVLWEYPLPPGMHRHAVEPVVAGRLLADRPGQWLLAGADGSIHIVAASGSPIDQFHVGQPLTGLATARWNGQHVLLAATPTGVTAWAVRGLRP